MISNVIWHSFFSDITKHVSSNGVNLQTLIPEFFETCMLQRLRNESLLIMTVECYKSVSNMFCLQWCYWLQDSNVVSLQRLVNFASPIQLSRSLWSNVMSKSSVRRRSLNDCGSSKTWSIDRSSSLIIFPLIWASHGAIWRILANIEKESSAYFELGIFFGYTLCNCYIPGWKLELILFFPNETGYGTKVRP